MTECEYRINAELKKEVEAFVEVLAKKYDLQLLSIETDLFTAPEISCQWFGGKLKDSAHIRKY